MSKTIINSTKLPLARNSEIVIQDFDSEVLIYDLSNDKAHHLNETISLIWKHCDGKTSTNEIVQLLAEKLKMEIEDDFIWLALDELNKANLLEEEIKKSKFTKLSRRKVLFRYALPAATLPIVMSLVSPESVHAQSCTLGRGDPCVDGAVMPCCSGGLVCLDAGIGGFLCDTSP